jgi:hypothetical protein
MPKTKATDEGLVTINVRAERERIQQLRREADERERFLAYVEAHKARSTGTVTFEAPDTVQSTVHVYSSGLTGAVRMSIARIQKAEFTVRDVEADLTSHGVGLPKVKPRDRLAMILKQLREKGEIELTHEGSGRDPHRYKMKK